MASTPISVKVETSGRFSDYADEKRQIAAQGVTAAVTASTRGFLTDLRQQLGSAFPNSSRAPNIVGSKVFPQPPRFSFGAAGTVFPRGKPGSSAELIIDAFSQGVTIVAHNARFLAIPTEFVPLARAGAAGVSLTTGRRTTTRMTPKEVEAHFSQQLIFIPGKRGGGMLVLQGQKVRRRRGRALSTATTRGNTDRIMFFLVPRAKLPKKLDPDSLAQKWTDATPGLIDRALPADF